MGPILLNSNPHNVKGDPERWESTWTDEREPGEMGEHPLTHLDGCHLWTTEWSSIWGHSDKGLNRCLFL